MHAAESTHVAVLGLLCVALAVITPSRGVAQRPGGTQETADARQQSPVAAPAQLAEQLGAKLGPSHVTELTIGTSVTAILTDSAKLATFGARAVGAGARVTIVRVGADRVLVEVDELEPVPRTSRLTLRLASDGRLMVIAK